MSVVDGGLGFSSKLSMKFFGSMIPTRRSRRCGDMMGNKREGEEDIPLCSQERTGALACKDGSLFGVLADRHAFN